MKDTEFKQVEGKTRYYKRVDIEAAIKGIAIVREQAISSGKYKDSHIDDVINGYPITEVTDSMFRHMVELMKDPFSVDKHSGQSHVYHLQFNAHILARTILNIDMEEQNG